jgi:hypothetical protein
LEIHVALCGNFNAASHSVAREMQRDRIDALFGAGRARWGLDKDTTGGILWMLTSRDVYHKLVHESGWSPDKFQEWLERTLVESLTDATQRRASSDHGLK